jgi:hypothetical protein
MSKLSRNTLRIIQAISQYGDHIGIRTALKNLCDLSNTDDILKVTSAAIRELSRELLSVENILTPSHGVLKFEIEDISPELGSVIIVRNVTYDHSDPVEQGRIICARDKAQKIVDILNGLPEDVPIDISPQEGGSVGGYRRPGRPTRG